MKSLKNIFFCLGIILLASLYGNAQNTIKDLSKSVSKGEYGILEIRLNMEDEFRTLEGRDSQGLARISLYTGNNKENQVLTKGFEGFNNVVILLNEMKKNGWKLIDTYPIQGSSLIITHYLFEKVKN